LIHVLDASVALKWFLREGEEGLTTADDILRAILGSPQDFAVPALFPYEMSAALCRRLRRAEDVASHLRALLALAIPIVEPDERLLVTAAEIAFECKVTAYDAAYLALARHLGGVWLTFDEAAYARVKDRRLAKLLG
jgi:predicted nucleic acid-binding protein